MLAVRALHLVLTGALVGCTGVIDEDAGEAEDPGDGDEGEPRAVDITGPTVLSHVQTFANAVCGATTACTIVTRTGHHPTAARALDILVTDAFGERASDGNALGDRVAAYVLAHQGNHKIWYAIWRQRYNDGTGWDPMEDRGSITQNHFDHVHVSFDE